MKLLAIDPGPTRSAWLVLDEGRPERFAIEENPTILARMYSQNFKGIYALVVEQIAAMGMAVGAEVFETCYWSGRFVEAWITHTAADCGAVSRLKRHEIKMHLCGSARAKDGNIRQALIDRFGGKERAIGKKKTPGAIGKKKTPGPLYGISKDCWSALAVAVTAFDRMKEE